MAGQSVLPREVTYWKLTTLNLHINIARSNRVMALNENLIPDQSEISNKTYVAKFTRTEHVKITNSSDIKLISIEMELRHETKETTRT